MNKVQSARLLATGKNVRFEQEKFRVRFVGLPEKAPGEPITTIAIECDGEPHQDTDFVRKQRPRVVGQASWPVHPSASLDSAS